MVIVTGLAVARSGQKAALATVIVPTTVYFPFAMAGLEVAWLVAPACVVSALSRALFPL